MFTMILLFQRDVKNVDRKNSKPYITYVIIFLMSTLCISVLL